MFVLVVTWNSNIRVLKKRSKRMLRMKDKMKRIATALGSY